VKGSARTVYITATDDKGASLPDLSPEEVTVKEDGTVRTVLDVGPVAEPMQVVLLIDDSGPGIRDIREGVASFIRIVQRSAEIAIVTTAKQNTVLVDFTSDPGALLGEAGREDRGVGQAPRGEDQGAEVGRVRGRR
jgi:hypothetical protein